LGRWTGRLWKVENNTTLYFGIEVDLDSREYGTLIIWREHEGVRGWSYTGRGQRRMNYRLWAKKLPASA
jgi:hypothetical protein